MNPANEWAKELLLAVVIGLVVLVFGAVLGGAWVGRGKDVDIAELKRSAAQEKAAAEQLARATQAAEIAKYQAAAKALMADKAHLADENITLKKRIAHVATTYRPAPGADLRPVPECIFTTGAVGLLNRAFGATGGGADSSLPGTDPAPGADDALDAGVRLPDLLAWGIDAGTRCRAIESQLNRVLDAVGGGNHD